MANSPSVNITQNDLSTYTVVSSATIITILGYSTKGPINEAVLSESYSDWLANFGGGAKLDPWTSMAVQKAFNQTDKVVFKRIANATSAAQAVLAIDEVVFAEAAEITLTPKTAAVLDGEIGVDPDGVVGFTLDLNGAALADFSQTYTKGTTFSATNIIEMLKAEEDFSASCLVTQDGDDVVIRTKQKGAALSLASTSDSSTGGAYEYGALTTETVETFGKDESSNSGGTPIGLTAREKGTYGDFVEIGLTERTGIDGFEIYSVDVTYGETTETFDDISFRTTDDNFFPRVISKDAENGGSAFLTFDEYDLATDAWSIVETHRYLPLGAVIDLGSGNDGVDISNDAGLFVSALSTNGDLGNKDMFDYHILITPCIQDQGVINAAKTLAEYRSDFLYLADPDFGMTVDEVIDWHNGALVNTAMINSKYVATYYPWLKDLDDNGEYIWVPPSVFVAEKLLEIDRTYNPWYAPAGEKRGVISASGYELSPSRPDRDKLYGDLNTVNPITFFSGKGLLIYGQKNCHREYSTTNRLNVIRMLIYVSKQIKQSLDGLLFEPNNSDTWDLAKARVTNILEEVKRDNGLEKYFVDFTSLNTAEVINQQTMKGVIRLIPMNTVEIIDVKINVYKSGTEISF